MEDEVKGWLKNSPRDCIFLCSGGGITQLFVTRLLQGCDIFLLK